MGGLSVIIPTFNRTKYLAQAVTSVLEQTVQPQEILIINDGSSAEFEPDLQNIASLSPLIRLINNESQKGVSFCRNSGLEEAKGEYVSFLDDDDLLEPDFIKKAIGELEGDDETDAIISQIHLLDHDKRKGSKHSRFKRLVQASAQSSGQVTTSYFLNHCPMVHSFMFRKSAIGPFKFPEDLRYGEDMYLWIEMVNSGVRFKNVDWVGGYFRLHESNASFMISAEERLLFCEKVLDAGFTSDELSRHLIALRGFYWSMKSGNSPLKYLWPLIKHPTWTIRAIWS